MIGKLIGPHVHKNKKGLIRKLVNILTQLRQKSLQQYFLVEGFESRLKHFIHHSFFQITKKSFTSVQRFGLPHGNHSQRPH